MLCWYDRWRAVTGISSGDGSVDCWDCPQWSVTDSLSFVLELSCLSASWREQYCISLDSSELTMTVYWWLVWCSSVSISDWGDNGEGLHVLGVRGGSGMKGWGDGEVTRLLLLEDGVWGTWIILCWQLHGGDRGSGDELVRCEGEVSWWVGRAEREAFLL